MKIMISAIVSLIFISAFIGFSSATAQERSQIEHWTKMYCAAAAEIMPHLDPVEVDRNSRWDLSHPLLRVIRNTADRAGRAVHKLRRIRAPQPDRSLGSRMKNFFGISADYSQEALDAQKLQTETIASLNRIIIAAQKAIDGINNASNRLLFFKALVPYRQALTREADRLNAITENSAPLIRGSLQDCTLKYLEDVGSALGAS